MRTIQSGINYLCVFKFILGKLRIVSLLPSENWVFSAAHKYELSIFFFTVRFPVRLDT